jgi:DNA-directed RNA polymerase specialized sigma24 family protein
MELRYHQGMRAREIAAEMGRTETAVKLLLHRGMLTLRSRMLPLSA